MRMVARQIDAFRRESLVMSGYTDDDFDGEVDVLFDVLSPQDAGVLIDLKPNKRLTVATVSCDDWVTTLYLQRGEAQPFYQVYVQVY